MKLHTNISEERFIYIYIYICREREREREREIDGFLGIEKERKIKSFA